MIIILRASVFSGRQRYVDYFNLQIFFEIIFYFLFLHFPSNQLIFKELASILKRGAKISKYFL